MTTPNERMYSKSHEWLKQEGDEYLVGVTEHAQKELGDLVFINLPNEGDEVTAGEALADVESVKAVSDVISPVTGTVSEVNEELLDAPEKINQAPYDTWIAKIKNAGELAQLMSAEEYDRFLNEGA